MQKSNGTKLSSGGNFNTLALNGTNIVGSNSEKPSIVVFGNGTDRNENDALKRRAKKKTINQVLMLKLIGIAKEKGAKDRERAYRNTYYCQSKVFGANGKLHGNYCKNRFCSICCGIRKAELITKYYPILKEWTDTQFLTLTRRAVKEDELFEYVRVFKKKFQQIIDLLKKRNQRLKGAKLGKLGKGVKPVGIFSLESNFNPVKKTYNPHFHLLLPNREIKDWFVWEWCKKWEKGETSIWGQKSIKVVDTEKHLIEVIKYGTKIFTAPDMKKSSKLSPMVYVAAMDNIIAAFKGIQIFGSFGLQLPKQAETTTIPPKVLQEYDEWHFNKHIHDWVNFETGEVLSEYQITDELEGLLENNVNTTLE